MDLSIQDLLTVGGASAAVIVLMTLLKQVWTSFNSVRFGALAAVVLGVVLVSLANVATLVDVRLGWGEAIWTGFLAGTSASGIYSTIKGAAANFSGG